MAYSYASLHLVEQLELEYIGHFFTVEVLVKSLLSDLMIEVTNRAPDQDHQMASY